MSDYGRTIPVMYDVLNQVILNPTTGAVAIVTPGASYLERVIVQLSLANGSITVTKPVSGYTTGTANIDNLFNDPSNLAVQTTTAGINVAGDWPDGSGNQTGGNANPSAGQFSIRLNCATTNALNKIGQQSTLPNSKLEILAFDSGGNLILSQRIPFALNMVQDTSEGQTPVATGATFLSAAQSVAMFVPFVGQAGQSFLLVSPDGTKAVSLSCDNTGHLQNTTISPYTP